MRDYGKVYTRFWSGDTARSLSDSGRLLALYLLTSPHSNIAGVFQLPDGYICEDMQWTPEQVSEGFRELFQKGFANRCETSKWVWVIKHLEWNPPENPNQKKAVIKQALSVPDLASWKSQFLNANAEFLGVEQKPSITVKQPLLNQKQKQEQKQEQKTDSAEPVGSLPASGFAIPLNDSTEWQVPVNLLTEWKTAFPAVDVEQELREMRAWSIANPANRKTARGVGAFANRWLAKAQDTPGRGKHQSQSLLAGAI